MATAKNCALDALRRERTARTYAPELGRLLESEWTLAPMIEEAFSPNAIKDDLLRMMFSCCRPQLGEEAQVALILHILCGFSVGEIANALVSTHAAIEKRITRGKKTLAKSKKLFDVTAPAEFSSRLPAVHTALYLLFNEGYHGANSEFAVRSELCLKHVSASGGPTTLLTKVDVARKETGHGYPQFLPDGDRFSGGLNIQAGRSSYRANVQGDRVSSDNRSDRSLE